MKSDGPEETDEISAGLAALPELTGEGQVDPAFG